ncbi:PadR family transcriptional regulator [Micromonospora sp. PLK6-60]|uniref:PadR family transcriptional regulator n=1 Tax=Micromonospora sp. PLK6-60 TaxID=2873383 RepID=UPI001CA62DDA|nr:helix-turn-helix transcriptional regulator [Micromonospora sp. PLK6-60]MBY8875047.1 PadR family transcriptional regulator [Micromonospora sp. PLK6-60]
MAPGAPRLTPQTVQVLRLLLADPAVPRYGRDIARETGLKTGTLHPILARLEAAGWVHSFWEDPAEHEDQGRPRRRYYRLTGDGVRAARSCLADADARNNPTSSAYLLPRPGYQG